MNILKTIDDVINIQPEKFLEISTNHILKP